VLPFGEGRREAIPEIQLGRVTLALGKALKQQSCSKHEKQGLSRLQQARQWGTTSNS